MKSQKLKWHGLSLTLSVHTLSNGGLGGIAWLDHGQDSDLGLYVTNSAFADNGLFRNNGDSTFTDITATSG